MTAQQAIERADSFKAGNVAPDELKLEWLTELDGMIYDEVILTHMHKLPLDGETSRWWSRDATTNKWVFADAPVYDGSNSGDELIVSSPDDVIYIYWLMAKIDLYSQELNKYNNSLALFDNAYNTFKAKYNRIHHTAPLPYTTVGVFR